MATTVNARLSGRDRIWWLAGLLVAAAAVVFAQQPAAVSVGPAGGARPPLPSQIDQQIEILTARLAADPAHTSSLLQLATAYLRKARESGDLAFADRANSAAQRAQRLAPDHPDVLKALGWAQLVRHEFAAAEALARRALLRTPADHHLYGILADALIERGAYAEAVAAVERMVALRPGAASYSRVSYVRELHGEVGRAIAAMELALEATNPADQEALAWTRTQLAGLQFGRGDLAAATRDLDAALRALPEYPAALAALAQVRAAEGRMTEALELYERVLARLPLPEVAAALGDLYLHAGRREAAEKQFALVEYAGTLSRVNNIVYNRELAYFYADHERKLDQAVALAEREAAVRRDIYTADTLAWAYFKVRRLDDADRAIRRALALGTRDARLHYHAGMIAHARGAPAQARRHLEEALRINPHFHVLHAPQARVLLKTLD